MNEFELKKWDKIYIDDIAYFANNKKIADNLRNAFPYPYKFEDAKNYALSCINNGETEQICRAIVIDNRAVGSVGIFKKDDVYCKSAEIGYWLAEEYWGRGIMTLAVTQLCDMAFEKFDIVRIFAEPFAHNLGSIKVLQKSGFVLEGTLKNSVFKNGNLFDSCIYALLK